MNSISENALNTGWRRRREQPASEPYCTRNRSGRYHCRGSSRSRIAGRCLPPNGTADSRIPDPGSTRPRNRRERRAQLEEPDTQQGEHPVFQVHQEETLAGKLVAPVARKPENDPRVNWLLGDQWDPMVVVILPGASDSASSSRNGGRWRRPSSRWGYCR